MKKSSYLEAGVSIDRGNEFVECIKPLIKKTHRPEVLSSLGGYAGLFSMNKLKYKDPVLVSTTDGVGTKLKLALEQKNYIGIGQDLVAMCVNDLLCVGAEPLFFLDYFATSKLELKIATEVLQGISSSLQDIHCALLGGETAEMPGIYQKNDFDLAGFAVGIVNRNEMIDGSTIAIGDVVLGLASSGVHSNGFSLVRKIIEDCHLDLQKKYSPLTSTLGEALLAPTRIYVNSILALNKQIPLKGIAHITGGGLIENPPRILPKGCQAVIRQSAWERPVLFNLLQEWAQIDEVEMLRVFNCGIGLVIIVDPAQAEEAISSLKNMGEKVFHIGEIVERPKGGEAIKIDR